MSNLRVGNTVTGTVVMVQDNLAFVDVGAKSEGRIYLDHFTLNNDVKSLKDVLKEGDTIRVEIAKFENGLPLLSRISLEEKEKRDKTIKRIMNHKPFMALVNSKNKNNEYVLAKDGVNVILPENYVDLNNEFDKDSIIGTEVKVVFVKSEQDEKGRTRIIVSRKQVQYNEERKAKEEEFNSINVDDIVTGTVERITEFGAFVKLNHIDALIHLTDCSHYRIKSVNEVLEIGQTVTCKVIKKTETKIQLSIKALEKTPWEIFLESHKVGDTVETEVVKKSEKFMLCKVERDVVGILNSADYSWNADDNFGSVTNEGDKLTLQITYIDKEKNKMTLSKKHLEYNPWQDVHYKKGEILVGEVLRFTNTGAIIKVGEIEGFLANKDASLESKTAQDALQVGQIVNVEVMMCDPKRWLLNLSIRSIEYKKEREYVEKYIEENVEATSSLADLFDVEEDK